MELVLDGRIIPCQTFTIDQEPEFNGHILLRVEGEVFDHVVAEIHRNHTLGDYQVVMLVDGELKFKARAGLSAIHIEPERWSLEFFCRTSAMEFA